MTATGDSTVSAATDLSASNQLRLPEPADTHAFGIRLAGLLTAGDLVVLSGPLGAGKTALAKGIGAGLGVREPITSPTFILARVHTSGRVPLVHVDAYRLGGSVDLASDVDALDLDVTADEALTVVEWGAAVADRLTDSYLEIQLDREVGGDERTATLVPRGPTWPTRLSAAGLDASRAS